MFEEWYWRKKIQNAFDLARALSIVLDNESLIGIVNVGNPKTTSVKSVAQKISILLSSENMLNFGAIPYRSDQVMILKPKCEKLTNSGWKPQISLDHGLSQTVGWLSRQPLAPVECVDGTFLNFKLPTRP